MLRKFISFEGGEGSGKTTQIGLFISKLAEQVGGAEQVVRTREPGGTIFSDQIRAILVEASSQTVSAEAQTLLLYAARSEHLSQKIRPALAAGKWVVTDRFSDSTFAYQGYALGVSLSFLENLELEIVGSDRPSFTIFLDIAPEIGLKRAFSRQDTETKYESLGLAFHQKLYAGFQDLIAKSPDRFLVVNANQSIEAVQQEIWAGFCAKFGIKPA